MKSRSHLALAALALASCAPEIPVGTFAGLDRDYVLTTTTPAFAQTSTIRLRYEDDWVPRTCEGVTYVSNQDNVIIEWRCRFATDAFGSSNGLAFLTGGLSDADGDGTYTGTIAGNTLNTDGSISETPTTGEFTMRPCANNGGGGPCSE